MPRRRRRTSNEQLPPPPTSEQVLAALYALEQQHGTLGHTAQRVAWHAGVQGARRHGRGAQGPQSWTGTMAPALRTSPRLHALARQGLVWWIYDEEPGTRSRKLWGLTRLGRRAAVDATHELRTQEEGK